MSCVTVIILIFLGDNVFLLIESSITDTYYSPYSLSCQMYIEASLKSLFLLMALKRYVGHRKYFTSDVFLIQEISTWGELSIFSWTFIPYCWTKILNIIGFFDSFCFSSFRPFLLRLLILKPLEASWSDSAQKWTFTTS